MIYYKRKTVFNKLLNSISDYFREFEFSKISEGKFSKFFRLCFSFLIFLIVSAYILYLFFLPNFIDEKRAEQFLANLISEKTKLIPDIDNLKVSPNYKFDINFTADRIKIKYPKGNDFISIDSPSADINLISLFLGQIDLNKIKTKKITINTNFQKSKKYSVFEYITPELFKSQTKYKLGNIKLYADEFYFNLYDENINQNFLTKINKFNLFNTSDFTGQNKVFKLTGDGCITAQNHKISDYDLNLAFKIKPDKFFDFFNSLSKLNYNPLEYAYKYKFYSKTIADLKINAVEEKQNISGKINLYGYKFQINDVYLPKNNAEIVFKGNKINFNSDFKFIKDQFIKIGANIDISKNKYIETRLNSNEINLNDLKEVLDIFFKILNIKFDSSDIDAQGSLKADLYIKSNFKTLVSNGILKIQNAKLVHKKMNLTLDRINSDINFQNNKINIINTQAFVNDSKFYLTGTIDEKTNLNLKANSDLIDVSQVINLIKSLPVVSQMLPELSDYIFKSGLIKINAVIKGNLKNPVIETNSLLKDFKVFIKSLKSEFYSPDVSISVNPDKKSLNDILFKINNSVFKFENHVAKIPSIKLIIKGNDVILDKTSLSFDGINVNTEGLVKNYKLKTSEAILNLSGNIPLNNKFLIVKTKDKAVCNFVSKINLKNNNINLNDLKIFSSGKQIVSISGEIKNILKPEFSNLKIIIPEIISVVFPQNSVSLDAKGSITLNGSISNPDIDSNLNVYNFIYRPLNFILKDIIISSKNSSFYLNSTSGRIDECDFDFVANADYKNKKLLVDFIQVNSNYINLNKIKNKIKNIKTDNLEIKNLKGTVSTLEMAGVIVNSLNFEGNYKENILTLNNFSSTGYGGTIGGNAIVNLLYNKASADLILKEVSVRKLISEVNEIKKLSIAASGKLSALIKADFILPDENQLNLDDIIRTSSGYVKFNIDNGELTQFAKLERFLQAGNILSQSILKLSLNSILSVITRQNTGDFKTIEGTVKINNSYADIQYIKTIGTNMSMHIEGKLNLLNQKANLKILGRIPTSIVNILGNFGKFTTQKLVDKISDEDVLSQNSVSPFERMFSTYIAEDDYLKIPSLAFEAPQTREFTVDILGLISDTKSINNFKWIIKNSK